MQQTTEISYRHILKSGYETRLAKNPRYSLRAYARDIKLTPQMLSSVLAGKKDLSLDSAAVVAGRLGLDPEKSHDFLDAVILAGCKGKAARQIMLQRFSERNEKTAGFRPLTLELFKAIADWYHLALLELVSCEGFKSDPRWIATRLGISVYEVREAIVRLQSLELLEEVKGELKRTDFLVSALSEIPAASLREHARQILGKGLKALEEQEQEERDISSITMAIDPTLLPEAKKMILQFRRKLCKFLESGRKKEVYVFTPALFRLTQKNGRNP